MENDTPEYAQPIEAIDEVIREEPIVSDEKKSPAENFAAIAHDLDQMITMMDTGLRKDLSKKGLLRLLKATLRYPMRQDEINLVNPQEKFLFSIIQQIIKNKFSMSLIMATRENQEFIKMAEEEYESQQTEGGEDSGPSEDALPNASDEDVVDGS